MTLEHDLSLVNSIFPEFRNHVDNYSITGLNVYKTLVELDLRMIKDYFNDEVYREFEHIYKSAKEVRDN